MYLVNPELYVSPVVQLLSGGLMLGAVFMATDYVTSPMSHKGMLIYGVCIGLLTVIIRLFGAYPEGMSFAILIMNAFTPASCDTTNELFIDGNRYDDIQPLLLAAAMLVTDYSSCMWDFALTDRPIFVLQDIIKAYEQSDRGFFVSPQSWPYTKIRSLQEIPAKYAVWDNKDNYHKHFEQMGSFETGHACERLTDVILTHTMTPRKNSGGKHHDKK